MKKRKFTLIELVVVVVTLGILALAFTACSGEKKKSSKRDRDKVSRRATGMREKGNRTTCLYNLKNLHAAIMQYQQNNNNALPFIDASTVTTNGGKHEDLLYLIRRTEAGDDPNLFVCPSAVNTVLGSSKIRYELDETRSDSDFSAKNNSYAYFMGKVDGNAMGTTMNNASGILADGWAGGEDLYDTEDEGWNHEGMGNWFTVGGSGKQVENEKWPDLVKGTPDAHWNAFKLW